MLLLFNVDHDEGTLNFGSQRLTTAAPPGRTWGSSGNINHDQGGGLQTCNICHDPPKRLPRLRSWRALKASFVPQLLVQPRRASTLWCTSTLGRFPMQFSARQIAPGLLPPSPPPHVAPKCKASSKRPKNVDGSFITSVKHKERAIYLLLRRRRTFKKNIWVSKNSCQ